MKPEAQKAHLIMGVVAKQYRMSVDDLREHGRFAHCLEPRNIAVYLCRKLTALSYPAIAEEFDKRDHRTVMHACSKVLNDKNALFRASVLEAECLNVIDEERLLPDWDDIYDRGIAL